MMKFFLAASARTPWPRRTKLTKGRPLPFPRPLRPHPIAKPPLPLLMIPPPSRIAEPRLFHLPLLPSRRPRISKTSLHFPLRPPSRISRHLLLHHSSPLPRRATSRMSYSSSLDSSYFEYESSRRAYSAPVEWKSSEIARYSPAPLRCLAPAARHPTIGVSGTHTMAFP